MPAGNYQRFSVTQLAQKCLGGFNPIAFLSLPANEIYLGSAFHKIAHVIVKDLMLSEDGIPYLIMERSKSALQASNALTHYYWMKIVRNKIPYWANNTDHLMSSLKEFINYLASLIIDQVSESSSSRVPEIVGKTFRMTEQRIEFTYFCPNTGRYVRVSGVPDLVLYVGGVGRVIDYKLKNNRAAHIDIMQCCIYCWMLKQITGLETYPYIMRFSPSMKLVPVEGDHYLRIIEILEADLDS